MKTELPKPTRVYQNHHLDSTRWDCYRARPGDVIITTSYKSGTTWTQQILLHLLHGDASMAEMRTLSPWVEARFMGIDKPELTTLLEGIEDPRVVKSHLPLDGLPYHPEVRYLIVGRDPRDVFMSFYNHYSSYTEIAFEIFNAPDVVGPRFEPCPDDPRELWQRWISEGWFEWESEGYPFWSNLHHTQSYWEWRHLPNLLFLHYNDMLADLEGKVREIADFCGIEASEQQIARTAEATTFANVKQKVDEIPPESDGMNVLFAGGQKRFFFKATNGRWRDLLTEEDLALYEAAKQRVLTPDCAHWLEQGGPLPS